MNELEPRIAVVEKAMENIEKGMSRMESKLDSLMENLDRKFVPRTEIDANNKRVDENIAELHADIKAMKERNMKIVGGIIAAIITLAAAVIQGLFT